MREKEICFSYLWYSIFCSTSWYKEKRHYEIWPYHTSTVTMSFKISPVYISYVFPLSKPRLWLWDYPTSQVLATLYRAGLVTTPLSSWHSLAQDPSTSNLYLFPFLQNGTNLVIYLNSPQYFSHTGLHAISTPALASVSLANVFPYSN